MQVHVHVDPAGEERHRSGFVWTGDPDRALDRDWCRARLDTALGVITGIHVGRARGAVPVARPFRFRMPEIRRADEDFAPILPVLLATVGGHRLLPEGRREAGAGRIEDQLSQWQDFLGGGLGGGGSRGGRKAAAEPVRAEDDTLRMSDELRNRIPVDRRLIRTSHEGALLLGEPFRLSRGTPLSGFDALRIAKAEGLPFRLPSVEGIDVETAQAALKAVDRPSSAAVAWYGMARGRERNLRLQAAESFPVLAGIIAERDSLRRAVDSCAPLQPLLAEQTGLPKAALKRLGRLKTPFVVTPVFEAGEEVRGRDALGVERERRMSASGRIPLDQGLRLLSQMPADRTPQTDADWSAFQEVMAGAVLPLADGLGQEPAPIAEVSGGNWTRFREGLARAADFEPERFDRRAMLLTALDGLQAIEALARTVVLPRALASIQETGSPLPEPSHEFFEAAFGVAGALMTGRAKNVTAHVFEMSRRYASRIPTMAGIEGRGLPDGAGDADRWAAYGEDGFPQIINVWTAPNGVNVVPARTGADLVAEGDDLDHCVGGSHYRSGCRRGIYHILSFRDQEGARLSTMQLVDFDGETETVARLRASSRQHYGKRNGEPPAPALEAAQAFLRGLRDGSIPVNWDEICAWRRHMKETGKDVPAQRQPRATWESALEFPWQDADARQAIWQEWRFVAGGKLGKAENPGVIYTEPSARALVALMSPRAAGILATAGRPEPAARETADPAP